MTDRNPEPNNPLGPYYPAETPTVPGDGRRWFALLVALLFILGAAAQLIHVLFGSF